MAETDILCDTDQIFLRLNPVTIVEVNTSLEHTGSRTHNMGARSNSAQCSSNGSSNASCCRNCAANFRTGADLARDMLHLAQAVRQSRAMVGRHVH